MRVFKNKVFSKWAAKEGLDDAALLAAVEEMERGLIDADLGGHVVKKLVFSGEKAQYIQSFAVWVGRDFPGLAYRAPCIRK